MVVVAVFTVLVGFARLTRWKYHRKWLSRLYTLLLITVGAAYSLVWAPAAERWLDPAFRSWVGPNFSDSLSGLLNAVACWMLGLVLLISMSDKRSYRIGWTWFSAITAAVMVVASRVGDLGRVEVGHEFQLHDWGTTVFTLGFTVMVCGVVVLLMKALRRVVTESPPQATAGGWAVGSMIAVLVPGGVFVGWVWWCLLWAPQWLAANHSVFVAWTAGPALVLLGVSGGLSMVAARGR
ncbi:hypothetical protein ACFWU5_16890 [Nocardia sp. NPDC058640]|uniref:hypothetical protein n=1 Tax=Nocardia sp. NPDC058640 TaxID=3346571 RepID=UPI00364B4592